MPDFIGLFVLASCLGALGWGIALAEILVHHVLKKKQH